MAFPTTGVLDTFNRTAENPLSQSSAWTNRIVSGDNDLRTDGTGCILGTAGGAFGSAFRTSASGADAESFVTVATLPATGEAVEVWVRIVDGGTSTPDGVFLDVTKTAGSATWTIWESVNGAQSQLGASATQAISAGDSIGIEVIGTTAKGYRKTGGSWTEILSRTTAVTAAGNIGAVIQQTTAILDDFGGGTVTSAPSPSVSDSVTVTESTTVKIPLTVNVNEAISITESSALSGLGAPASLAPSVNDSVTVAESVAASLLTNGAFRQAGFAATTQVALPMSVRQRNTLAVFVRWAGPGPIANLTSISDTNGNTYTLVGNPTQSGSGYRVAAAVATNIAADGALTVIANFDASPSVCWIAAHEVTQRDLLAPIDGSSASTQDFPVGTDGVSSGNITTSRDGAYIFGGSSEAGSGVPTHAGTGFLMRTRDSLVPSGIGFITEDKMQTSAGTTAATFSPDPAGFAYATVGLALQFARAWLPTISESVTVTESSTVVVGSVVSGSEDVTVAESVTVQMSRLRLEASDAVTLTEAVTGNLASTGLSINVFDLVLLEGSVPPAPNTSETISVTELVVVSLRGVAAAETITVTESTNVRVTVYINTFDEVKLSLTPLQGDDITVTESVSLAFGTFGARQINVNDLVTVNETRDHAFNPLRASASDQVVAAEAVIANPTPLRVVAGDDVVLTDQPTAALVTSVLASAFDAVTVTENVLLTLKDAGRLVIALSDAVTVTESATILAAPNANVFDAVTVAENVTIAVAQLKASVNDAITVTDVPSLTVSALGGITAGDAVTVSEAVTLALSKIQLSVFENVSVGEGRDLALNPLDLAVFELVGVEDAPLTITGDRQPVPRYRGMFAWERWIRRNE